MKEGHVMKLTLKGKEFSTNKDAPKVGEKIPDFTLKDVDENSVNLNTVLGDVLILSTFPDINTRTCSAQTDTMNDFAGDLNDVTVLSISVNTAEEQRDWCGAKEVNTLMLHGADRSFAKNYGLYLEEMDKMARAIFVVNRDGMIVYREIVEEMSNEPNYEKAVQAARHEESEI